MAASVEDIVATVGTWLAVVLALIALIGVITPYLILKAASSDRARALRTIDVAGTGYVRTKLKLSQTVRLQTVKVPLLTSQPGSKNGPELKSRMMDTELAQQPPVEVADEEQGLIAEPTSILPSSSTSWVVLAHLTKLYSTNVEIGDPLILRGSEYWFPIHRFFILAVGLRGRYGKRQHFAERLDIDTTSRIFTEVSDGTDERLYHSSPLLSKLYGTTGTLWWRHHLDKAGTRFDEVYYAPHIYALSREDLLDPLPLDELFWLAIGCLPIRDTEGNVRRVYDLFAKPTESIRSVFQRTRQGLGLNDEDNAQDQLVLFQRRSLELQALRKRPTTQGTPQDEPIAERQAQVHFDDALQRNAHQQEQLPEADAQQQAMAQQDVHHGRDAPSQPGDQLQQGAPPQQEANQQDTPEGEVLQLGAQPPPTDRGGGDEAPAVIYSAKFTPREHISAAHRAWAEAIGASAITHDHIYYLEVDKTQEDPEHPAGPRLIEADRQIMAVGLLRLIVSPAGYLTYPDRPLWNFFKDGGRVATSGFPSVPSWTVEAFRPQGVGTWQTANTLQLREEIERLQTNLDMERSEDTSFSRELGALCYNIDESTTDLLVGGWKVHHIAIAVLLLTNPTFRQRVMSILTEDLGEDDVSWAVQAESLLLGGTRYDLHLEDEFLRRTTPQAPQQTRHGWFRDLKSWGRSRGSSGGNNIQMTPQAPTQTITRQGLWLILVHSANRLVYCSNYINSKPLLVTVNKMTAVVHVSPSMSVPLWSSTHRSQRRRRDDRPRRRPENDGSPPRYYGQNNERDSLVSEITGRTSIASMSSRYSYPPRDANARDSEEDEDFSDYEDEEDSLDSGEVKNLPTIPDVNDS